MRAWRSAEQGNDGRRHDEGGFTIIELMVALGLVAIVATGFLASISLGFRTIALARQRTTASELATKALEHVRNYQYDEIAINPTLLKAGEPALAHSTDPTQPNYFVDDSVPPPNGPTYDVTGSGTYEPLIVDSTRGKIDYVEDPITIGSTVMEIYMYATWVDDPNIASADGHDYKRVTVVIRYKAPAVNGVNTLLRSSSLFTPGTVTIAPPPSPTTTTTAPPPPSGTCPTTPAAPSGGFTIGANADAETGFTNVATVSLQLSLDGLSAPVVVNFSNDGTTWGPDVVYDPLNPQVSWTLTSGSGTKTVCGRVRDGLGNAMVLNEQSVVLDATAPSAPGTVTSSLSCSGNDRTVAISWFASSDAEGNLRGYRVWRSTNSGPWSLLSAVSTTSYSDTHAKNLDSVRYYVVAYDKAGNVSAQAPSPVLSFGKNQCS
jgi:prepilin-type N-terminal cleavage/methylation domain-containing protein